MNIRSAPLFVLAFALLAPAHADSAPPDRKPAPAADATTCVEVRIGQDVAGRLDCLNRELRAEVDKVAPATPRENATALAPTQLGQPTPAEVKQRLGNAYGHSLVPQRPPQNFTPPLPPTR